MPQTRFVLSKALEMNLKIIVVVNKIDRPDARLDEIADEVLELLMDLDASEEQLENTPFLYCSGRAGTASFDPHGEGKDLKPLFDTIMSYVNPPEGDPDAPLQMLISSIDYNEYVGRIGIGRIERGTIQVGQQVLLGNYHDPENTRRNKIVSLLQIQGLQRVPAESATVGDIVWISGIENISIGDTVCAPDDFEALPFTKISEPTVEMTFSVNDSPFAGQTAESARKEAQGTSSDRVPGPIAFRELAIFFLFLAAAGGIFALLYSQLSVLSLPLFQLVPWALPALAAAVVAAAGTYISRQYRQHTLKKLCNIALMKRFGTTDTNEITAFADAYTAAVEVRDAAQADLNTKSTTADAYYNTLTTNEQAILLEVRRFAPAAFDIPTADQVLRQAAQRRKALSEAQTAAREAQVRLDLLVQQGIPDSCDMELSPPLRSRETVADALAQAQVQLAAARSATDRLTGQLHAMGDPDGLRASAESLQSQTGQLQEEYDALRLAMDTLTGANTVLQNRFSPQLSRRTAEIFHELTEGRYTAAALDRSFHLTARPAGDPIDRDIQLLSAGAADQLYLSARLAICELVLPSEKSIPIILDDALTNFDDERCAAALRWLKQAAAHRQILLFTCHSREADFFAGDPEVAVQRL